MPKLAEFRDAGHAAQKADFCDVADALAARGAPHDDLILRPLST